MAITKYNPRTIWLGGDQTIVNTVAGSGAITPGMLLTRFDSSGAPKFKAHDSAAATGAIPFIIALNQPSLNKNYTDNYADGDLIEAGYGHKGSYYFVLVPSGVALVAGDGLESAGDGKFRKVTSGTVLARVTQAYAPSATVPYARAEVV